MMAGEQPQKRPWWDVAGWWDSLYGRTAAILLLTLGLSHGAVGMLIHLYGNHDKHIADSIVTDIQKQRDAMLALTEAGREDYLKQQSGRPGGLRRNAPDFALTKPTMPGYEIVKAHAERELGPQLQLWARESNHHQLWASFPLGDKRYWMELVERPEMFKPAMPLARMIISLIVITLIGALALLWPLYRPLRRLAQAHVQFGLNKQATALQVEGPRELAALAGSFNRMVSNLTKLEAEQRTLLAGVSHDLRTPLARLRMRLALLDETDTQPFERDLDDIERVTEQFLAFVRGDADALRLETLDPLRLLQEIADRYSAQPGITVQGDATTPPPYLVADRLALTRALTNLLDNALTYAGPTIELELRYDKAHIGLAVRDHGPGLSPAAAEQARQPFVRLDPARGGRGHCGLGLAIVERIASKHGGSLMLETATGGGLRATLYLPLPQQAPSNTTT